MIERLQVGIKIAKLLSTLEPDDQVELVRQLNAAYGRPLTPTERTQRYRFRLRNENVSEHRNGNVSDSETDAANLPSSFLSSSPSSTPDTTAEKYENYRKRKEIQEQRQQSADRLIDFLNEKAGRSYRKSPAHRALICARIADGFTEQNLRGIIARKAREWAGTEMAKYLRPETLFNRTKAESYLGERPPEAS